MQMLDEHVSSKRSVNEYLAEELQTQSRPTVHHTHIPSQRASSFGAHRHHVVRKYFVTPQPMADWCRRCTCPNAQPPAVAFLLLRNSLKDCNPLAHKAFYYTFPFTPYNPNITLTFPRWEKTRIHTCNPEAPKRYRSSKGDATSPAGCCTLDGFRVYGV